MSGLIGLKKFKVLIYVQNMSKIFINYENLYETLT